MPGFDPFANFYDRYDRDQKELDREEALKRAQQAAAHPDGDAASASTAPQQIPLTSEAVAADQARLAADNQKAEALEEELKSIDSERHDLEEQINQKRSLETMIAQEEAQRDALDETIRRQKAYEETLGTHPLPQTEQEKIMDEAEDADIQQKTAFSQKRLD